MEKKYLYHSDFKSKLDITLTFILKKENGNFVKVDKYKYFGIKNKQY